VECDGRVGKGVQQLLGPEDILSHLQACPVLGFGGGYCGGIVVHLGTAPANQSVVKNGTAGKRVCLSCCGVAGVGISNKIGGGGGDFAEGESEVLGVLEIP
jgi:hypothetical protein